MRKPAPATIIALVALFVALGGSGYAAVTISGTQIKNRSIAGKKLKKNTVTGTELNESKLGTVPSASNSALLAGLGPSAFLGATATAADSDKLDGLDSTAFLGATAKASDSDKLDGLDSTDFVPGSAVRRVSPITVQATYIGSTTPTPVATIGQLAFIGLCQFGSYSQRLELQIESSAAHSAYADLTKDSYGTTYGDGDMPANTARTLAATFQLNTPTTIFIPVTGEALSVDGHQVSYDLYMAQNAQGATNNQCVFGGSFVVQ